eukprot:gb/GEZN01015444.1/.p1 GENE.gb/GEZN01015444.1/~~gb/GEZN01015444.1/.p1  ORF type:complete len:258 (-),score=45.93 gb/GEZN01015444.1/:79-852(-)
MILSRSLRLRAPLKQLRSPALFATSSSRSFSTAPPLEASPEAAVGKLDPYFQYFDFMTPDIATSTLSGLFDTFHYIGMPWWAAVAMGGVTLRIAYVPISHAANIAWDLIEPKLPHIKTKYLGALLNELPVLSTLFFTPWFITAAKLGAIYPETLVSGGLGWIEGVGLFDPSMALSVVTTSAVLVAIEARGVEQPAKIAAWTGVFGLLPLTFWMPSSALIFITSSTATDVLVSLWKTSDQTTAAPYITTAITPEPLAK